MHSILYKTLSSQASRNANFFSRRSLSLLSGTRFPNHGNLGLMTQINNSTKKINNKKLLYNFSTLGDILKREISEEKANPLNEIPEDLSDLKRTLSADWTIVDGTASSSDGATIKMYKKEHLSNGSKVTISFHCQDSLDPDDLGFLQSAANAASDAMGSEDEEQEEDSTPVKFDVTVSRAGKIMHLSCTSENAEATIDSITMSNSEEEMEDEALYRGPMIEDLAEDLREALEDYLKEECGVNEDVSAFIAMYADYREQMEYINWLKNVKNIVD